MLTLVEVFCSTAPVCSATFMKRLLNSSSSTGSARIAALSLPRSACSARALQHRDVRARDLGGPAGLDHGRGDGLDDQRRPADAVAGDAARCDRTPAHRYARSPGPQLDVVDGHRGAAAAPQSLRVPRLQTERRSLDGHERHPDRALGRCKSEPQPVGRRECLAHRREWRERHRQRRIRARVLQVHAGSASRSAGPACPGSRAPRGPRLASCAATAPRSAIALGIKATLDCLLPHARSDRRGPCRRPTARRRADG